MMLVSDFEYNLPEELIAQHPPAERGSSRMLVLDRRTGRLTDDLFENLPQLLRPGDLLVLNDSRVLPARLYAVRSGDAIRSADAIHSADTTRTSNATRSDDASERSSAQQSAQCSTQQSAQPTGLIEVLLTEPVEAQPGSQVDSQPPNRSQATERQFPAENLFPTENSASTQNLSSAENLWRALVKPGRKVRLGERLLFFESGAFEGEAFESSSSESGPASGSTQPLLTAEVIGLGAFGERTLRFAPVPDFHARLDRIGHIPLPPYIRREQARQPDTAEDRERYQTVYSRTPGSAAAPTAGLHFTPRTLAALEARGVEVQTLTLHVGLGTFQPVRVNRLDEIRLHAERYTLPAATAEALNRALAQGRRIVAAGTTTTRALEHIAAQAHITTQAHIAAQAHIAGQAAVGPLRLEPHSGSTSLFIAPGHRFRIVNGLLTNFHLSGSTLLMLAAAFAAPTDVAGLAAGDATQATGEAGPATGETADHGRRRILAAYAHAIGQSYRFYSYGDCMLLL